MKFTIRFFQDLDTVATTPDELYRFVLSPFKGESAADLRNDLDTILNSNLSDAELKAFWRKTDADIVWDGAGVRAMLNEARRRL